MNSFFKNFKTFAASILAAATLAFAAPALANCDIGCVPTQSTPPSTPSLPGLNVTLNAGGAFGGEVFGSWAGNTGNVEGFKQGYVDITSTLNAAGGLCGQLDCNNSNFTVTGSAGERGTMSGWASGNNVRLLNSGTGATLLQVDVQKILNP